MARWPVTVAQFAAFVNENGFQPKDPNCLKGVVNHPVVWVGWHDALAYCRWLNEELRKHARERLVAEKPLSESECRFWQGLAEGSLGINLPSEAEWEKGARGTDGRIYPWGNDPNPNRANYNETGLNGTSAVGCFPGGVSPYECEDLSGNVWEWTRSLWGNDLDKPTFAYPYDPSDGREDLQASDNVSRVLRGGAFLSIARLARCAARLHNHPDDRVDFYGFRVVASPLVFSDR